MAPVCTYFDLWGCVRFPGSSKVHGEFAVKQAWQGCPSSHLILLRLHAVISMMEDQMRSETLTGNDHRPWRSVSEIRHEKGASDGPAQLESALLQYGR